MTKIILVMFTLGSEFVSCQLIDTSRSFEHSVAVQVINKLPNILITKSVKVEDRLSKRRSLSIRINIQMQQQMVWLVIISFLSFTLFCCCLFSVVFTAVNTPEAQFQIPPLCVL